MHGQQNMKYRHICLPISLCLSVCLVLFTQNDTKDIWHSLFKMFPLVSRDFCDTLCTSLCTSICLVALVQGVHLKTEPTRTASNGLTFPYIRNMLGCWMCSCWTLSGTLPDSVQQLHVQQPSMYAKPEAASAVLISWWWAVCRPKHVELHINMK